MSESPNSPESNRYTAEAVIESLEKAPETIFNVIEVEADKAGSPNFTEDLNFCFAEADDVEKREIAREILSLLGDMTLLYNNESRPDSVEVRAKLKDSAKNIVRVVLERIAV